MRQKYDDNSIQALKKEDRVRDRVGVMLGSDDLRGAWHTVIEIVGNAADEAQLNPEMEIKITYHSDGSITVEDEGRGVPLGWNENEQRWNWDLIYAELYAGGKYTEDSYSYTIGLNGVGAASAQYTSEFFEVTSYRDGKCYYKEFKAGKATDEPLRVTDAEGHKTGTIIHWKPDKLCFTDINFTHGMFTDYCRDQSNILKIKIRFIDEHTGTDDVFDGQGGLDALLHDICGDIVESVYTAEQETTGTTTTPKSTETPYKAKVELKLAFLSEEMHHTKCRFFHNTGVMQEGEHFNAFQNALSDHIKPLGQGKEIKILPYDYQQYVGIICSTYSTITSFSNQTKTGVNNDFIYTLVYTTIKRLLAELKAKRDEGYFSFIDKVIQNAENRKRLDEYRQMLKSVKKTGKQRMPEKLADCRSKDNKKNELYIVEGDSAMGACKLARDASFQAIIPIRGKILNCQKASLAKIMASDCIQDLITVVGCGVDLPDDNGVSMFDINKLRYSKIIFCTDADVDAYQIRVLLFVLFYTLMPELVKKGYVYIAETPLFEIETSEGSKFAFDWQERDNILADCKARGVKVKTINRSKGLGENDPKMMSETTMKPATRRLIPLQTDITLPAVRMVVDMLFGKDINKLRKEYILNLISSGLEECAKEDSLVAVD